MVGGSHALKPRLIVLAGLALLWAAMLRSGTGALDRALLDGLYAGGDRARTIIALVITRLGDPDLLTIVSVLVALLLILRREARRAGMLLAVILPGRLLVDLQKALIARPRPDAHLHLVGTRTDSFPSGHAASAVIVWVTLALLIPREARWRRAALAAAALAAAAAGVSRPMLGVHWPSDVVAGWCFGLFWLLLLSHLLAAAGTPVPPVHSLPARRERMDKTWPDDSALIDHAEPAPGQGGTAGGNLQRDVASRGEEEHETGQAGGESDSVTRVHKSDKPREGDRPNLPNRD